MNQETTSQQPASAPTPQQEALLGAFAAVRARHADFDLLEPIMDSVVRALFPVVSPDWSKVSCDDFVETIYVVARYASFTAEVREAAFANALQAAKPLGIM